MKRVDGTREMEIKSSLNKDIISVPEEGTEPVLLSKTGEEEV